jgi:hypothetical protein
MDFMNENEEFNQPQPHPEDPRREIDEKSSTDLQNSEKDRLERVIDQYLFTPRSRSRQHAKEFLMDWMQRYSRG